MKRYAFGGLLLLLLLGPSSHTNAQEPPSTPAATATAAEEAATPTPSCSDCHDQAKHFITNPHARGAVTDGVVSNDACAACHGDGTEHMESGGDKTKIAVPRGKAGSDETCMLCHDVTTDRMTRRGMHANSNQVNCLTCHSIHASDPRSPHLVAKPQLALCGSCHTQAASIRNKPYAHRLDRGGMTCSTCHEPHGRRSTAERSLALTGHLRTTRSGEAPCVSCHTEKRGPFVFSHGGTEVGECTTCHETHGSSNPNQLRRGTVKQVCIECHSPISTATLGSQPPSFHNLSLPRYQNCTTCHVAVHGSNRDPQLLK
jgi:DmsE family decaheme c-type cytochrome